MTLFHFKCTQEILGRREIKIEEKVRSYINYSHQLIIGAEEKTKTCLDLCRLSINLPNFLLSENSKIMIE